MAADDAPQAPLSARILADAPPPPPLAAGASTGAAPPTATTSLFAPKVAPGSAHGEYPGMGALAVETTGVRPEARMEVDTEMVEDIEVEVEVEVEGDMQMEVPLPLPVILFSFPLPWFLTCCPLPHVFSVEPSRIHTAGSGGVGDSSGGVSGAGGTGGGTRGVAQ